jgi:heat shock protein HslJ
MKQQHWACLQKLACCALLALCLAGCQGGKQSAQGVDNMELTQARWALVSLNQQPAQTYDNQPEVHLVFSHDAAGMRISGSDGCNRLIGMAQMKGATITFGQMGTTMMACPQGQEQGQAFLQALAQAQSLQMQGNTLRLMRQGKELAVFEKRAL